MEDRFTHIGWKNLIIVENGCEMGDRFSKTGWKTAVKWKTVSHI
jgi:hypothetical protein